MKCAGTVSLAIVALLSCAGIVCAQCVIPPVAHIAGVYLTTPAARYTQALTYVDHHCFAEARALLAEAAADLVSQSGVRAATLRNLVVSANEYVGALEALDRGQRPAGYDVLQRVIERGANVVSLRAVITLGTAVVRDPDSARWRFVQEPLQELARRGYVEADILLIERQILGEGVAAGIALVEHRLEEERALQHALSLQVFLVELYARAKRLVDALLLLNTLERDAADTLLDLTMRRRLLMAGVTVSSALVTQGRTELTEQRETYIRALAELKRFSS